MRLVNYGAGEMSDRLTILALKLLYGLDAGKDVKHFRDERNALLVQIRARTLNGVWFEQVLDLGATNAALWQAEDHLRGRRRAVEHEEDEGVIAAHYAEAGRLAFRIQALNDQRAALIERINQDAGDAGSGKEKLG